MYTIAQYQTSWKNPTNWKEYLNSYTGLRSDQFATMYKQLSEKIERTSKLVHFAMAKLTMVAATLPPTIKTYVNYYVKNLGDESFENIFIV